MDEDFSQPPQPLAPQPRAPLGAWWHQGWRTALLQRPSWDGLQLSPAIVAALVLVPFALGLGIERLYIPGPALFHWPALLSGWLGTVLSLWVCWWLAPSTSPAGESRATGGLALFAMMAAQAPFILLCVSLLYLPLMRGVWLPMSEVPRAAWWTLWALAVGWFVLAQAVLLWRCGRAAVLARGAGICLLAGMLVGQDWAQADRHWYPLPTAAAQDAAAGTGGEAAGEGEPFRLTQETLEQQAPLLQARLAALEAGRPGVVDVFAITFAPYADEDVFMRESRLVAEVMASRFGARGKTLQLVNNPRTAAEWPWATPLNLERAIRQAAQRMDRDEDILFLHLTSHGARDGRLAAEFGPLAVDSVTPQMLKRWLDDAGVRYRVISVSACYSGSWIAPLADAGTLVMTAADAEHTSYGCGRGSPLTYFGRAMYDEELRRTWSFEAAHAAARTVIAQREKEAGKKDGYSNPQIRVGERIRPQLARLEEQQQRDAGR